MAKMSKQQQDYLLNKMRSAANEAKRDFEKAHPSKHAPEAILAALEKAGFLFSSLGSQYGRSYVAGYLTLPLTDEMVANESKVKDFCAKVDAALSEAQDKIYLGGDDAIAMLRDFQNALKELV